MKSMLSLVAASLVLLASSAQAVDASISISVPDPNNTACTVTGTSLVANSSGGMTLIGGVASNCGTSSSGGGGSSTANVVLGASPSTLTLSTSGSQPTSTVTWTANAAGASCSVVGANALTTSSFTISQGTPSSSGSSTVASAQVQPLATAVAGTYSFTVSGCTFSDGTTTLGTVTPTSVSLTNPNTGGGTGSCLTSQTSDTTYKMNRVCSAAVTNPYLGTAPLTQLDAFANVYGTWPVSPTVSGSTRVYTLAGNQFVALAFQPSPSATIKVAANATYGGGTLSVSTVPGGFTLGDTAYGVVCSVARNASTGITISSNGTSASCQLDPNQTYYLNISTITAAGAKGCVAAQCSSGFTVTQVN